MTGCPANLPLTHAPGQQHDTPFQAVVVEAHHCHQPQAFYAQLRQQGLTAIHFIPQLAAGDAALWGEFLCAVFHRWVREDIGRINILLFSETLSARCGETLTQPRAGGQQRLLRLPVAAPVPLWRTGRPAVRGLPAVLRF